MPFALTNQGGMLSSTGPTDVCKTPSPTGTVPMPYPNMAKMTAAASGKLSKKVSFAGSKAAMLKTETDSSNGDEAGTGGGVISSKNRGPAGFVAGSTKVMIEGSPSVRQNDPTKHNGKPPNTAGTATVPSQTKVMVN